MAIGSEARRFFIYLVCPSFHPKFTLCSSAVGIFYLCHTSAAAAAAATGTMATTAPGLSLGQMVEGGWRPTEAEVRRIAEELLDILSYLHELRPSIVHRDIKPEVRLGKCLE